MNSLQSPSCASCREIIAVEKVICPACEVGLVSHIPSMRCTPVVDAPALSFRDVAERRNKPARIPIASRLLVWALAYAPISGTLLMYIAAFTLGGEARDYIWIQLSLSVLLGMVDEAILGRQGIRGLGNAAVIPPVYLFKRAEVLRQTPLCAWVWLVLFVSSLFIVQP